MLRIFYLIILLCATRIASANLLLSPTVPPPIPIAFNAAADLGVSSGGVTTYSASYTVGSGINRMLVVAAITPGGSHVITGATYNSVAMTFIGNTLTSAGNVDAFFLLNPASGTNNVVISASSGTTIFAGAADYINVAQTGQPDAAITNRIVSGSVTTLTTSLTPVMDNCWAILFVVGVSGDNNPPGAGAGSTSRTHDATFGAWAIMDSNGPIHPISSYSMTSTEDAPSNGIGHVMATFSP